jgi:hypothetical protein
MEAAIRGQAGQCFHDGRPGWQQDQATTPSVLFREDSTITLPKARPDGEPMSKSDFDDFVKRQQAQQQDAAAAFDPKQQLDEWLGYLDALYKQITAYLQDYTKSGAAQLEYRDIQLNEDFIGS